MSLLLPKDQPKRCLRLKRFYMAMASYAVSLGLFSLFTTLNPGLLAPWTILPLTLGVLGCHAYFFYMLRFGDTEQRADPSMALPQIIVAITWHLFLVIADAGLRDLFMFGYVMAMMFGVLSLRPLGLAVAALYAVVSYGVVVLGDVWFLPQRFDANDEFRRITALSLLMLWCVMFGSYISSLRRKLSGRNRELQKALSDIQTLSTRDDLTQAFNRRYIMDALKKEKSRCDRGGGTFSVVLLDLDHFKSINDQYGHLAGDRVLVTFVERIRNALRGMDVLDSLIRSELARYGGEEFIVLLPDTDLTGALTCAERLCRVTREKPFDDVFDVTLSAGVASYVRNEPVEAMLQRADQGLYRAKSDGRDRVVTLETVPFDPLDALRDPGSERASNVVVGHFGAPTKDSS